MKLTIFLFVIIALASFAVKGAVLSGKNPSIISKEESIEQKPFSWLLKTESWGSTDPASILPKETITSCGGHLEVDGQLSYILYEPVGGFVPNTRCVWVLHSHLRSIEIFTDTQSSTTGNNGLIMNHYASAASNALAVSRVPHENNAQYSYVNNNGEAYLMFSSNEIGRGLGIRIAVRSSGTSNTVLNHRTVDPIILPTGSINLEYLNSILYTYLFQPGPDMHTSISIRFLDLEVDYDNLRVFTLIPYHVNGDLISAASYTGLHPFGPPNSETSTEEPRLYILHTDTSILRDGVTLAWTSP